ncbi:RES domain-containing protein [Phenylobacterium sp.]|uniref:RES family NAD+ phosphorylase n=1 Tax=Phenylobacterium sp. TaxID=1871053 RepID=UPI0025E6947C|nr:RES domain-containing protein [Phenylobacterium sp.]
MGEAFRAHDPRWSWTPLSGRGAALRGGRFNWPGLEALYLSLSPMTAVREAAGGFLHRLEPLLLCAYTIDCDDVVDLRTPAACAVQAVQPDDLACAWAEDRAAGRRPASHEVVKRLLDRNAAGMLAPSYAHGAASGDTNLILWRWGPDLPHRVQAHDPSGRLPRNQLSWT